MSSGGKGKGKGTYYRGRGGKGKGKGKGRGKGKGFVEESDGPIEKSKPIFTKLKDVRPGGRSYDLILQVGEVTPDCTREEKRGSGRVLTIQCTEAIVGDDSGSILLISRQQEHSTALVPGARVVLLNTRLRRAQESFWLEVDSWGAIKPLDQCTDLLPENFDSTFELNKNIDRSKKIPPKPVFTQIDALEPEKKGVYLVCKVLDVRFEERPKVDGTSTKVAEATVGDTKGCITLIARGPQTEVLQKDSVVVVFNAHIEMFNKEYIRLVADRWADVKPLDSVSKDLLPADHITSDTVLEKTKNKSELQWMLVEE